MTIGQAKTLDELYDILLGLDGQSYGAYKSIRGDYQADGWTLCIDEVQGDPFAAPSHCRVLVEADYAQLLGELSANESRILGLTDFLTRQFAQVARQFGQSRGSGGSGRIEMARPSQAVLQRTSVIWHGGLASAGPLEARFTVGLPAQGRRVLGRQAAAMLCEDVPEIVARSLQSSALDGEAVLHHVKTVEDSIWLRSQLSARGLVAFVPDGSVLARQSGVDERPLEDAIAFESPDSLRVSFDCPNGGKISGLGIPQGVTLIVGGGYHGKSTLLQAIEQGVYGHISGDGRELVVTEPSAVKVRAEDGRSVAGVNLSPFINHLPLGQSTENFSTPNASGSTSQAASIVEALEAGAGSLLMDEDTSATNFMIRDRRMQALIAKEREPITPFVDKVRQLYEERGVSTILVMGGSGDYFEVADTVIAMDQFLPGDVTAQAKQIAAEFATERIAEGGEGFGEVTARRLSLPLKERSQESARGRGRGRGHQRGRGRDDGEQRVKSKVRGLDAISIDREEIDLAGVAQLVEEGQARAIAAALVQLYSQGLDGKLTVAEVLDGIEARLAQGGLDELTAFLQGNLAMPRRQDLAAGLNRWRAIASQACVSER